MMSSVRVWCHGQAYTSDRTQVEVSKCVKDILRFVIADWQPEPCQQQQNYSERIYQDVKKNTNWVCIHPKLRSTACSFRSLFVSNHSNPAKPINSDQLFPWVSRHCWACCHVLLPPHTLIWFTSITLCFVIIWGRQNASYRYPVPGTLSANSVQIATSPQHLKSKIKNQTLLDSCRMVHPISSNQPPLNNNHDGHVLLFDYAQECISWSTF